MRLSHHGDNASSRHSNAKSAPEAKRLTIPPRECAGPVNSSRAPVRSPVRAGGQERACQERSARSSRVSGLKPSGSKPFRLRWRFRARFRRSSLRSGLNSLTVSRSLRSASGVSIFSYSGGIGASGISMPSSCSVRAYFIPPPSF